MNLYPVNLNITNKKCLVVGGGEVATRKVEELVGCGAEVVCVSPEISPRLLDLVEQKKIQWLKKKYSGDDQHGAFLVFAATDNKDVQNRIMRDARKQKILVNSADNPGECSFHVPAKVRRGNFLLTVSTGGGSPALAAKLRRELEADYGIEYQQFVELLASIREKVVSDGESQEKHQKMFKKLLQLNILQQIQREDWSRLEEELDAILPDDMDVKDLIDSIQLVGEDGSHKE